MRAAICAVAIMATLSSLDSLYAQTPSPRPLETLDAKGRVVSRTIVNADGSSRQTAIEYWAQGANPKQTIDVEIDARGRLSSRTAQQFDPTGRVMERSETRVDGAGHESGTLTTFTYDESGAQRRTVKALP